MALHEVSGSVKLSAIAKRQGIPLRYLEQLFNHLRRQGFIVAERGPRGGYRLKQPANQIPVSALFQSLEPSSKKEPGTEAPGSKSPTRSLWKQVEKAVQTTLQATTLDALVNEARERTSPFNHRYTFHI